MIAVVHVAALSMLLMLLTPRKKIWIVVAIAAALLTVLTATPIELRFWSAVGTPSITALALLCDAALRRHGMSLLPASDRNLLFAIATIGFVILEPAALGLLPIDAYRVGLSPVASLAVGIVAAIFLAQRYFAAACVIAAALLSFDLHLLGSANLWDYFADPIVGVIAIVWLIVTAPARVTAPASSDR